MPPKKRTKKAPSTNTQNAANNQPNRPVRTNTQNAANNQPNPPVIPVPAATAPLPAATAHVPAAAPVPDMAAGIAQAFQAFLTQFVTPQPPAGAATQAGAMTLDKGSLFDKFLKGNPQELSDPNDPDVAENWLKKIEKIFAILDCTSLQKVAFAEYTLQGPVENWWQMVKRQYAGRENELTWEKFLEEFNNKYYHAPVRTKKQMQFHNLEQKNMTVADYETKFADLSRFAPSQVATEENRVFMFQRGLRQDILSRVELFEPKTYGDSIKKALIAEQGIENEKARQQNTKRERDQPKGVTREGENFHKKRGISNYHNSGIGQSQQKACPKCNHLHSFARQCDGTLRTCFTCGGAGHMSHQCRQSTRPQQSNWNQKQSGNGGKFGQKTQFQRGPENRNQDVRGGNQNQNKVQKPGNQGKVFAMSKEQADASPSVVQGR